MDLDGGVGCSDADGVSSCGFELGWVPVAGAGEAAVDTAYRSVPDQALPCSGHVPAGMADPDSVSVIRARARITLTGSGGLSVRS